MRRTVRLILLATLPVTGGCFDLDLGFGTGAYDVGDGCTFCVPFDLIVDRGTPTILVGDTTHVRIWSSMGHERGTFTVSGSALLLVSGTQLKTEVSEPSTEARVVGIAEGRDTVRARAADTAATALIGLYVVDSASVTGLNTNIEPNARMRLGDTRYVDVILYVGHEFLYGGPTSVTVTNADILSAEPAQANRKAIFLRAKAVGTTEITLRFLERSRTYRIEVIP